jgi:dihydropteroate synthase
MPLTSRPRFPWRLRTRTLPLGRRTLLMGILNVTPDSFSDGAHFLSPHAAHDHALFLLDEGADLIDIGGESTRPNAAPVEALEEQARILPVIHSILKERPEAILSVDTYHATTAQAALDAGVEIINDVSGLLWDPAMAAVLAKEQPGVVLMHTRGAPRAWPDLPPLPHAEILPLVLSGLTHSLNLAEAAGIPQQNIILDPGFGFGKLGDENFTLLARFADLAQFNLPLLAGISRKRFLTAWLQQIPLDLDEIRLHATSASNAIAILACAHILRVHDISAARASANVGDSILNAHREDTPI